MAMAMAGAVAGAGEGEGNSEIRTASSKLSLDSVATSTLHPEFSLGSVPTSTLNSEPSMISALRGASEACDGYVQPDHAEEREGQGLLQKEDDELAYGAADYHREGSGSGAASLDARVAYDLDRLKDRAADSSFDTRELDVIESALRALLDRRKAHALAADQRQQKQEVISNHELLNGHREHEDQNVIERLLKKVEAAREDSRSAGMMSRSDSSGEGEETDSRGIQQSAQATSRAARAAAAAAEKVADSVEKNSAVVRSLCSARDRSSSEELRLMEEEGEGQGKGQDSEARDKKKKKKGSKTGRDLLRQHTITHIILGVMCVTTVIWRWTVYSAGKEVNEAVSNPFGMITEMLTKGDDGSGGDEGPKLSLPFHILEDEGAKKQCKDKDKKNERGRKK